MTYLKTLFSEKLPDVIKAVDAFGTARKDREQRGTAAARHADEIIAAADEAIGRFTVSLDPKDFDAAVKAVSARDAALRVMHVAKANGSFSSTGREHISNDEALALVVNIVSTLETEVQIETEREADRLQKLGIVGLDPDNAILRSLNARLEQAKHIEEGFRDSVKSSGADRAGALALLIA